MNSSRAAVVAATIVCVLGGGVVAGLAPASAARTTVRDQIGDDNGWGDIRRVEVTHAGRWLLVVIHQPPRVQHPDQFEVWVDSTPRRPGPDFVILDYRGIWGSDQSIYRVRRWHEEEWGRKVDCAGLRIGRDRTAPDQHLVVEISVPRRCLGGPRTLRLQAVSAQENLVENDYAPGKRRQTRWLRAG